MMLEWCGACVGTGTSTRVETDVKLLVTGGSGFIGAYFHRDLTAAGHEVVNLDLVAPSGPVADAPYVKGDVRDGALVEHTLREHNCDGVVHLAAAHHDFGIPHDTYFSVNEHGSKVVCDAMDAAGVKTCVFYSTVATYGDAPTPHHEEAATRPNSPYGASKLAGEAVFRAWTEQPSSGGDERRALIIRPTVTFGVDNFANMYSLIRQIHGGKYLQFGAADNIKSLSYVENIVQATLFLLDKPGQPAFDIYNYIDKPDFTSGEIARTIYDALGKKPPAFRPPYWFGRLAALPFDLVIALTGKNLPISGARFEKLFKTETKFEADKLLDAGFVPPVTLREGITRMAQWYAKEGKDQAAEWRLPPDEPVLSPAHQHAAAHAV